MGTLNFRTSHLGSESLAGRTCVQGWAYAMSAIRPSTPKEDQTGG